MFCCLALDVIGLQMFGLCVIILPLIKIITTMNEKITPTHRKVSLHRRSGGIMMVTTDTVTGCTIEKTIGFVSGSSAQMLGVGRSLTAGFGQLLGGGDVPDYTALLEEARQMAISRLMQKAAAVGANAVVGLRLATGNTGSCMVEVCAYGTAVKLGKE